MQKEKLQKAIIVGHFVQGAQLALRFAIDFPDKAQGVITIGGPAKFISIINGKPQEFSLKNTVSYIDDFTAPKWFKAISKTGFDDGNYLPEIYSLSAPTGKELWNQSASVALPVMIRYLCEFFASDITLDLDKIKCPVLILRPAFNSNILENPVNNYIKPQFIDSWNNALKKNPLIQVKDIPNASSFTWKDNAEETYREIGRFIAN